MNSFKKVIGYESVKNELMQVCDMVHNRKEYEKLGAKMPNGILLEGDPGIGKTLMAKCFIEESGLQAYTIRKNKSENFTGYISEVFEEAKKNAPCIVFLDDMDKFANEDDCHRDADEYVAVQSAIDDARDKEVFVLATVNEIHKLPDSLTRAGRFDRIINMERPSDDDCTKIIRHYLSQKAISEDLNIDDILKMINYSSCAELETIANEAAIHAAYERKPCIDIDDFIYAILRLEYNLSDNCEKRDDEEIRKTAIHEAGHVVMSEVLLPESIGFASVRKDRRRGKLGFVHGCKDVKTGMQNILISLAGKAATELYYGTCDMGCMDDLRKAYYCIRDEISEKATLGFGMVDVANNHFPDTSESMNSRNEAVVQAELERYMFRAREILAKNREFLEKVSQALLEKETLLASDIKRIMSNAPDRAFQPDNYHIL